MVDLPAPDGPASTVHSPACTEKETPVTQGSRTPSCRCMVNVFATSLSSSATAMADLGRQDRRNQQLGVRLAWVVEDLVGQTTLDDLAVLHDHDPVRQQPCDTKIVGHDHD